MSNWLGFSLTPHLRVGGGGGDGEIGGTATDQAAVEAVEDNNGGGGCFPPHIPAMPLRSDHCISLFSKFPHLDFCRLLLICFV